MSTGATANLRIWFVDAVIGVGFPPTIVSIDPDFGPEVGGTFFTITGSDFTSSTTVTFDGLPATSVVMVTGTTLTGLTPPHAAGLVDVVVDDALGSDTLTDAFSYFVPVGFPVGSTCVTTEGDEAKAVVDGATCVAVEDLATSVAIQPSAATVAVVGRTTSVTVKQAAAAKVAGGATDANASGSACQSVTGTTTGATAIGSTKAKPN